MKLRTSRRRRDGGPATAKPPLILYVEDNEVNRDIIRIRLRGRYRIVLATDDREACERLRELGDEIFCILMDIELQGSQLSGIELSRLICGRSERAEAPAYARDLPAISVPLLFVSAYGDEYDDEQLSAAGSVGFIDKPIDFRRLNERLATLS